MKKTEFFVRAETPLAVLMGSADSIVINAQALVDPQPPTLWEMFQKSMQVCLAGALAPEHTILHTFRVPEIAALLHVQRAPGGIEAARALLRAAVATEGHIEVPPNVTIELLSYAPALTREEINQRWSQWSQEQRTRYSRLRESTLCEWFSDSLAKREDVRMIVASWASAATDLLL